MKMNETTLYAHFYGCKGRGFVIICRSERPVNGIRRECTGKREARKIAREYNAIPYNF